MLQPAAQSRSVRRFAFDMTRCAGSKFAGAPNALWPVAPGKLPGLPGLPGGYCEHLASCSCNCAHGFGRSAWEPVTAGFMLAALNVAMAFCAKLRWNQWRSASVAWKFAAPPIAPGC